uniref:Uncharacterized protein n=1 Tax=Maylandia zebra TaxID=106582 RepID=A0A3P9C4I3_9CICH
LEVECEISKFLPPNTKSLIQPINQGAIHTFKLLCIRITLYHLVEIYIKMYKNKHLVSTLQIFTYHGGFWNVTPVKIEGI